MKVWKFAAPLIVCLLVLNLAHSKPKKSDVSAVFENARYVYVEAVDGDILKPGLFPEDRQAIADVEDSLRDWNRYAIAVSRDQADLVFVVRKGRLAAGQVHGGISIGPRSQPGQPIAPGSAQRTVPAPATEIGARAEVGEPDDILRVYTQNEGQLKAVVWNRSQDGGLDAPGVQLVRQLKDAVERAYPPSPAPNKKP